MAAINNPNADLMKLKRTQEMETKLLIIQLNCNGLYNKLAEIKMFIYRFKPDIFCLCETFVSSKYEHKFISYNSYWQHRQGHNGGLGPLVSLLGET